MSSPNPMTREELIESAALDAFGLLDEYETALFTRSFHHAPVAVQNEIIAMQADLVSDERLLPSATPAPQLRERVLEAVAEAIKTETAQLEPLAVIGRPRHNEAEVAGVILNGSTARFWRAAAFVLSGAVIVVSYFCVEAYRDNHRLAVAFVTNTTGTELDQMIGSPVKDFIFDAASRRIAFNPAAPGSGARAAIYFRENSDDALLIIEGLTVTEGSDYSLRARDASGNLHPITTFASLSHLSGTRVNLNGLAANLKNMTLEITNRSGTVLLASI